MALFGAMSIAGSGMLAHRKWLDAVSDNISNINTASRTSEDAFKERMVNVQAVDYGQGDGGVQVSGVSFGSGEGRTVYEPDNPLADEDGNVKYPDIDLGDQMAELMMAQRGYQANVAVIERAKDAYTAALQLGKG
jgi:flagellar basal-body rod protein FlgC